MSIELTGHLTLEQAREFLEGLGDAKSQPLGSRAGRYAHLERCLRRFGYWGLGKPDRGLVREYLRRTTGLSRA